MLVFQLCVNKNHTVYTFHVLASFFEHTFKKGLIHSVTYR